jgi:hypothetical protein
MHVRTVLRTIWQEGVQAEQQESQPFNVAGFF